MVLAISSTRTFGLQTVQVQILPFFHFFITLSSISSILTSFLPSTPIDINERIKVKTVTNKIYHDNPRGDYLNWIKCKQGLTFEC